MYGTGTNYSDQGDMVRLELAGSIYVTWFCTGVSWVPRGPGSLIVSGEGRGRDSVQDTIVCIHGYTPPLQQSKSCSKPFPPHYHLPLYLLTPSQSSPSCNQKNNTTISPQSGTKLVSLVLHPTKHHSLETEEVEASQPVTRKGSRRLWWAGTGHSRVVLHWKSWWGGRGGRCQVKLRLTGHQASGMSGRGCFSLACSRVRYHTWPHSVESSSHPGPNTQQRGSCWIQ